jgi:hypothetical protein
MDVPDDVVAAGKVFEWLDENDTWPEFEEVLQHEWHLARDQMGLAHGIKAGGGS